MALFTNYNQLSFALTFVKKTYKDVTLPLNQQYTLVVSFSPDQRLFYLMIKEIKTNENVFVYCSTSSNKNNILESKELRTQLEKYWYQDDKKIKENIVDTFQFEVEEQLDLSNQFDSLDKPQETILHIWNLNYSKYTAHSIFSETFLKEYDQVTFNLDHFWVTINRDKKEFNLEFIDYLSKKTQKIEKLDFSNLVQEYNKYSSKVLKTREWNNTCIVTVTNRDESQNSKTWHLARIEKLQLLLTTYFSWKTIIPQFIFTKSQKILHEYISILKEKNIQWVTCILLQYTWEETVWKNRQQALKWLQENRKYYRNIFMIDDNVSIESFSHKYGMSKWEQDQLFYKYINLVNSNVYDLFILWKPNRHGIWTWKESNISWAFMYFRMDRNINFLDYKFWEDKFFILEYLLNNKRVLVLDWDLLGYKKQKGLWGVGIYDADTRDFILTDILDKLRKYNLIITQKNARTGTVGYDVSWDNISFRLLESNKDPTKVSISLRQLNSNNYTLLKEKDIGLYFNWTFKQKIESRLNYKDTIIDNKKKDKRREYRREMRLKNKQ